MHSNRHTPKISVITVTYNAGEVLEDTIQSVISQTLSANPTKDCMMQ